MLAWSLLPQDISSPWAFVLLGSLSIMLLSAGKAGFGGSLGLLAMPLMIYACDGNAMLAGGVMLPLLIAADYLAMLPWLGRWDWRAVAMLLPGTAVGIALGGFALWAFQRLGAGAGAARGNAGLMLGVGIIALGFVAIRALKALARRGRVEPYRPLPWHAVLVGATAGVTSTLAHAAGPVTTMYLLPQQMDKARYAATTVLFYWIGNQLKLVPYFALGLIDTGSLGASLSLLPAAAIGVVLGVALHHRLAERHFNAIVYVLLALAGVHLIVNAAAKLWA